MPQRFPFRVEAVITYEPLELQLPQKLLDQNSFCMYLKPATKPHLAEISYLNLKLIVFHLGHVSCAWRFAILMLENILYLRCKKSVS